LLDHDWSRCRTPASNNAYRRTPDPRHLSGLWI
jgi:hypothetical protein